MTSKAAKDETIAIFLYRLPKRGCAWAPDSDPSADLTVIAVHRLRGFALNNQFNRLISVLNGLIK